MRGIRFYHDIASRWRSEVNAAEGDIKFLSPYVTGPTATAILSAAKNPSMVELYTVFNLQNFLFGSSSISCLQELYSRGLRIFHTPNLHAKALWIPGKFVSTGSQNLTSNGRRNRELSVGLEAHGSLSKCEKILSQLIKESVPVTESMLTSAALFVKKKRQDIGLKRLQETLRDEEKKLIQLGRDFLRAQTESYLSALPRARRNYLAKVRLSNNNPSLTRNRPTDDWTTWVIGEEGVNLLNHKRYLVVKVATMETGWARVNKSCVSFVDNELNLGPINIAGVRAFVQIEARKAPDNSKPLFHFQIFNVIDSKTQGDIAVDQTYGFNFGELEIQNGVVDEEGPFKDLLTDAAFEDRFKRSLTRLLLEPFEYERATTGVRADRFFGKLGTNHCITIKSFDGLPFLVCE